MGILILRPPKGGGLLIMGLHYRCTGGTGSYLLGLVESSGTADAWCNVAIHGLVGIIRCLKSPAHAPKCHATSTHSYNWLQPPSNVTPWVTKAACMTPLDYLEGQGNLVSRLIRGMIRVALWVFGVINLLSKSP